MSVPVGARGENLSTVFTLASELLALCIKTTMNERHFPHKYTRELGEQLVAAARRVFHEVYLANNCVSDKERVKWHVSNALDALYVLQAEIHLNFLSFKLKANKAGELSDMVTELRTRFMSWSRKAACC